MVIMARMLRGVRGVRMPRIMKAAMATIEACFLFNLFHPQFAVGFPMFCRTICRGNNLKRNLKLKCGGEPALGQCLRCGLTFGTDSALKDHYEEEDT